MSQKMSGKKIIRENISKKSKNPLNLGKKSQNPEKNCRDFLIPKIFVRFFQSNLPLDLRLKCLIYTLEKKHCPSSLLALIMNIPSK